MLRAFGNGALAGMIGSGAGLLTASLTMNPILGGSVGGLVGNLLEQGLSGKQLDAVAATVGVVGGSLGSSIARNLLPLRGPQPYLNTFRNNYGKNSYRLVGQELVSESVEGDVSAVTNRIMNALTTSDLSACVCQ